MEMGRTRDPDSFLPLTDLAFSILLVLSEEPLHGYGLLQRLRTLAGRESLRTGTVYAALARLQDDGLVREREAPADDPSGDARRKYYAPTALGTEVAAAEAERLRTVLSLPGARGLVGGRGAS